MIKLHVFDTNSNDILYDLGIIISIYDITFEWTLSQYNVLNCDSNEYYNNNECIKFLVFNTNGEGISLMIFTNILIVIIIYIILTELMDFIIITYCY